MSYEPIFTSSALTVMFDGTCWVGIFEKTDAQGYSVARHIFGKEPNDEELYDFLLHGYSTVKFTAPQPVTVKLLDDKQMSFKRRQREIERILSSAFPADQVSQQVQAQKEAERQSREQDARAERKAEEAHKYQLRQAKRHEKHRGH